jgi:hypothetical protein
VVERGHAAVCDDGDTDRTDDLGRIAGPVSTAPDPGPPTARAATPPIAEIASAPAETAARATDRMSAAPGDSLAIRHRSHVRRTAATSDAAASGSTVNGLPPRAALGQPRLSSTAATPASPSSRRTTSTISPADSPHTLTTTGTDQEPHVGSCLAMTASTPGFW